MQRTCSTADGKKCPIDDARPMVHSAFIDKTLPPGKDDNRQILVTIAAIEPCQICEISCVRLGLRDAEFRGYTFHD